MDRNTQQSIEQDIQDIDYIIEALENEWYEDAFEMLNDWKYELQKRMLQTLL